MIRTIPQFHDQRSGKSLATICRLLAYWLLTTGYCLLLSAPAAAQTRWQRQSAGTLAWLHAVYFLDQNRGWVVGSKGVVLATVDGGKTWQAKAKPTTDVLRDVYFADESHGWLVCETNVYELKTKDQTRTYLMTTDDGGANWTRLNIPNLDVDARLVRVIFSPGGRGWIFGEAGTLYATVDQGRTWKRQQIPTRHLLLGGSLVDNDRGWLVGAGSTILQTADGGETWHLSSSIAPGVRFNGASFVDNRQGWAVGGGGNIFRTVNGGRIWQPQVSGVAVDLADVKFVNAFDGWAAGADGTIVHTFDGGSHWTIEASGTTHPLERIYFTDRDHGWAVGFGGSIVAYNRTTGAPQP